jgi:hypothetical protein
MELFGRKRKTRTAAVPATAPIRVVELSVTRKTIPLAAVNETAKVIAPRIGLPAAASSADSTPEARQNAMAAISR